MGFKIGNTIWKGKHHSQETKQKISEKKKGKWSVGTGFKIGNSLGSHPRPDMVLHPIHLGKHHSEEVKKKMSEQRKGKLLGASRYNWKGGIYRLYKSLRGLTEYKQWRSDVFERDGWTCQTCGVRGGYLTVHHIKSFRLIVKETGISTTEEALECKELWDRDNGVTLCEECHKLTDNYYKGRGLK